MAHLPRFHRRKKDVAAPTLITSDLPRKTTPPPGDLPPGSPMRSFQKLSPFRVFQRSSGKRARDSPPASLPHSPAAAPTLTLDCVDGRPVSPLSLKTDPASDEGQKPARPPKMPAFLDLSQEEIENKFSELVWRERNRLMQSVTNPSPDFRWARVTGPHLKLLDRYLNIQPWHNNRVKLQVPDGHVDYVNASPIALVSTSDGGESDRYIAMQGPKQSSTDHVWRMVAEQLESPGVIVMLTETHEGHMEKCYPYFPRSADDPPLEINERDEFGDGFRATVRCEGLEETPAGDAIELRKLVIRVHHSKSKPSPSPATPSDASPETDTDSKMTFSPTTTPSEPHPPTEQSPSPPPPQEPPSQAEEEYEEEKTIYHFLYKKWPDFGVPALTDLDSFFTLMRLSREKNKSPQNPRIVHCSAGVGRSGTFIALEHLLREMEAGVFEHQEDGSSDSSFGGGGMEVEEGGRMAGQGAGGNGSEMAGRRSQSQSDTDSPVLRLQGRGEDPVFETVDALREQRRTMVQAEAQYVFIYRVLRQLWVERYGAAAGSGGQGGAGEGEEVGGEVVDQEEGRGDGEPAAKRLEVDPLVERG